MKLEAIRDGLMLLETALREQVEAARLRHAQLGVQSARQFAALQQVLEAARALAAGLARGVERGERRPLLLDLINLALAHDAEWPDGGALLRAEHVGELMISRLVAAHLVGEFSFSFLACEESKVVQEDAVAVLNVLGGLHLEERWRPVVLPVAHGEEHARD